MFFFLLLAIGGVLEPASALPCSRIKLFAAADKRAGYKCEKQLHPFILGKKQRKMPIMEGEKIQLTLTKNGRSLGWKCRALRVLTVRY